MTICGFPSRGLTKCGLALLWALGSVQAHGQVDELELKAAFVYNFLQFVEWPKGSSASLPELTLCVSPFSPLKRQIGALEGKPVQGGPLQVRLLDVPSLGKCRVIVLDGADAEPVFGALRALPAGHGVLTVVDDTNAARSESVFVLGREGGRVVFSINADAAARAGVVISSRLLRLARGAR